MKILGVFFLMTAATLSAALSTKATTDLIDKAKEVQKKAYPPYSHYYVGAALLTKSGKVFSGCNVENASYGLTICAERTAVFKAVSEGDKEIEAIVVVTKDGGMPCGACRQVLNEFNPKMIVIAADEQGKIHVQKPLNQLLSDAFGPANLEEIVR
jgi:cytidine deaminase